MTRNHTTSETKVMGVKLFLVYLMILTFEIPIYGSQLREVIGDIIRTSQQKTWFHYLQFDLYKSLESQRYIYHKDVLAQLLQVVYVRTQIPLRKNTNETLVKNIEFSLYGEITYTTFYDLDFYDFVLGSIITVIIYF